MSYLYLLFSILKSGLNELASGGVIYILSNA
jgi:hypothetical protein